MMVLYSNPVGVVGSVGRFLDREQFGAGLVTEAKFGVSHVQLPRPNTSNVAAIRDAMPLGARAVLYLIPVPPIPDNEKQLWFGVDQSVQQWDVTTPQGLILERQTESGEAIVDLPIDGSEASQMRRSRAATSRLGCQPTEPSCQANWIPRHPRPISDYKAVFEVVEQLVALGVSDVSPPVIDDRCASERLVSDTKRSSPDNSTFGV